MPPAPSSACGPTCATASFAASNSAARPGIANYVVDFACIEARLVVELDGSQHLDQTAADKARTDAIESAGYLVIRFWNDDVLKRTDAVLAAIDETLTASR